MEISIRFFDLLHYPKWNTGYRNNCLRLGSSRGAKALWFTSYDVADASTAGRRGTAIIVADARAPDKTLFHLPPLVPS